MLNYQKKSRTKVDKICFDLLKECKEIYNNLQRAYYNKDIKLLEQIHNREKDLRSKEDHELLNKSKNTVIICYLLSVFRGFYLTSSPLMGSILNNLEEKKQKP